MTVYAPLLKTNGSKSLAFSNFPAAGSYGAVTVQITVASAAHTITLPASVSLNNGGIQGINTLTNVITFASAGTYTFTFATTDGVGGTIATNTGSTANLGTIFNPTTSTIPSGVGGLGVLVSSRDLTNQVRIQLQGMQTDGLSKICRGLSVDWG